MTDVFDNVNKTLEVTDNGDGTITVVSLLTGGLRSYGPDGKVVFHNDGQIRLQLLIDYGGTLYDKMSSLKDGLEDIALVFLTEDVDNVTPAPVADAGYLDGLDLTSETFTVVGYGTDEYITGSVASPTAITVEDGARSYKDVSVITEQELPPDRFVKITKSVCFGDQGGPLFHEGTLVALNTWTFSYRCDGPNLEYRVDSAPAQSFLDANL